MRIIPICAPLFLAMAFSLSAQDVSSASAKPNQPVAQPGSDSAYTLKTNARRVLVDVIVKDKKGAPVQGLKAPDFEILENGQPQQVHDFEEHTALTTAESAVPPRPPTLPPGEFTNFVPIPQTGTFNIILIDRLNTSQVDQLYLQQQLIAYLKQAHPDARTAVFGLTDHLVVLQNFTSSPETLLQVINANSNPKASPIRDSSFGHAGTEDLSQVSDSAARFLGSRGAVMAQAVRNFQEQYQSFQAQMAGKITLDALNQLSRSMSTIPGRKNLIWFTGNFPSSLFPGDTGAKIAAAQNAVQDQTVDQQFSGLEDEFRETVNLLTAAQIAIYPVDAQGLRTLQGNNASAANREYVTGRDLPGGKHVSAGDFATEDMGNELTGIAAEHLGMERIARETGGEAFYNNNNLVKAVDTAISGGSNFYSIAYIPTNSGSKPVFRSISVKVSGQKYNLSYRRGYYTDTHDAKPGRTPLKLASTAGPPSPISLRTALLPDGPEPTQILMRVRVIPVTRGGDEAVVPGNQVNPDASKAHGAYQSFALSFAASGRALSFKHGGDGRYRSDIDFVTYVYDAKGVLVNLQSSTMRASYSQPQILELLRTGIPFVQRVSVPQEGDFFLRVAVHDNVSDKVGALEIPVSALRDLPLLTESQPAPTPPSNP